MKRLIIFILLLLLSVWAGLKMQAHPGYVLIAFNNLSIETTLWVSILTVLLLFILFYTILRFAGRITSAVKNFNKWFSSRRQRKTIQGLLDLAEGNWKTAEKKLANSVNLQTAIINYLGAAFAAQKQHQISRRDAYLSKAQKLPKQSLAASIIQAKLQIDNKQWKEALETLQYAHNLQPRNIIVLKYLQLVMLELRDYSGLQKLLPKLYRRKVINSSQYEKLEENVYRELLLQSFANKNTIKFWEHLPRRLKTNPEIILAYVNNHPQNPILAESLIKNALKKIWNEKLVTKFGLIKSAHPLKQLKFAENLLKSHPQSVALLIALGRICKAQELWGPARFHLEKSLKISPTIEAYFELAAISEMQGQTAAALEFYKKLSQISLNTF